MNREAVLRSGDARLEAALDHPPADEALQPAKREEHHHARNARARNRAGPDEEEKGDQENKSDQPAQQTVGPFPPVDSLELIARHARMLTDVLRDALVLMEGVHPIRRG